MLQSTPGPLGGRLIRRRSFQTFGGGAGSEWSGWALMRLLGGSPSDVAE